LCIIDIADPANPAVIGQISSTNRTRGVAVQDDHLFVADGDSIKIYDISNIYNPQRIGACRSHGSAVEIKVAGNYAFVANSWAGLAIFDISNLQAPVRIVFYQTGMRLRCAVRENLVYILDYEVGLYIVHFDAPTAVDGDFAAAPPDKFALSANYPNPFNPATRFDITCRQSARCLYRL
jgi:hypothetical protein